MASLRQIREKPVAPREVPEGNGLMSYPINEWDQTNQQRKVPWINPDQIFNDYNITFIYTTEGVLYASNSGDMLTHYDLIEAHPELKEKCNGRRGGLALGYLLGRISHMEKEEWNDEEHTGDIISFWNTRSADYDHLLVSCLEAIKRAGRLAPDVKISTPVHGTVPLSSIMGGQTETKELTPEEQEHWELARNMHLMRGDQKRDAMKKLGVGGGGKPHPMQKAMDDAGLRVPGQKWWAPTSESVNDVCRDILHGELADYDLVYMPDGEYLTDKAYSGHTNICIENLEFLPLEIQQAVELEKDYHPIVIFQQQECLAARVSDKLKTIAFWGGAAGRPIKLIPECLKLLINDKVITPEWTVCTTDNISMNAHDFINKRPDGKRYTDHRSRGPQIPGVKWWAPTSEDFDRKLSMALTCLW